ncbi:MAG: 50S ribosomal protein L1 [Candidatus Izemoplasmatales bacterium]|jgi:large subunit ribosomal protein L1|nr:50S ribosomal protein L1 [Candidatus Izemoplasmatales bacterium]MDD4355232.1 50S ribosomal protein L1 [Candidatus Izemoplasmatales bacterium]MDD5601961.1 50S ribosomal protein L1 [Candidatus Izemoplasmatales bacterium]MDY0373202.1 50S ribosomal protein L1 [Candidatus Izemoplasmatales bacterium]NLF48256.1 50S ribosomal protein L1 [Acholeplasmataceae bacterium]
MAKKGKKYLEALAKIEKGKKYPVLDACVLLKSIAYEKFNATVELALNLNLDSRKAEQNLRGALVLPHGTGKEKRVLVFARGEKAKEATEAGADFVGAEELVEKIQGGWFDYDVVIATPDMMAVLGKIGRLLGPKGLMPNPKTGTVTQDITKAVSESKGGKITYRVDKNGNILSVVGKVSFAPEKLAENIRAVLDVILKAKPATVKGVYLKNAAIASTMGPGIDIEW